MTLSETEFTETGGGPITARRLSAGLRATARSQGLRPTIRKPEHWDTSPRGIVASANRLTSQTLRDRNKAAIGSMGDVAAWQQEAWELLDLIGEQRFLAHTLAGRMSQAAFYVGRTPPEASPGTRPEHVEDARLQELLDAIGDGPSGMGQLVNRFGVNLFVAGEAWLVGIPPKLIPGTPENAEEKKRNQDAFGQPRLVDRAAGVGEDLRETDVLSLVWKLFSVSEISVDQSEKVSITFEDGKKIEAPIDDLFAIRIWRPHPRQGWEADSPTRASLPVLRELLALTQHVGAQVDSRLAGAGLLLVATSISAALKQAAGIDESDPADPLMDALTEAMQTAIRERDSAAALVPIVVTVPDEAVDKVRHITFSTDLDKEAKNLRDEAIRRLALGQDAPPELLLGVGGMNHWGAWLVREDVVKTHLEPPLALLCDALTTNYLRPLLHGLGYSEEDANEYLVWYDVDHLITRPNRGQDAKDLHNVGAINDRALREANGFEEGDAPDEPKIAETDPAVELAMQTIARMPSLFVDPGLPAIVEQIRAVLDGPEATREAAEAATASADAPDVEIVEGESSENESTEGGPPMTSPSDAETGTPANPGGSA